MGLQLNAQTDALVVDLQSSKEKNEQLNPKIREIMEMVGKLNGSEENSGLKRVKKKNRGWQK